MPIKKIVLFLLSLSLLYGEESHYELGLGMGAVSYPSYIGSKSINNLVAPLPYIRYHKDKTSIGKGGIKYLFFDDNKLSLDLSLGASLPVDSSGSAVREGMSDLDFALEIGPRLNYTLYDDKEHKVTFRLPVRAVVSTNIQNIDTQGFLVAPNVDYKFRKNKVQFRAKTGPIWADKTYHNYFYGVSKSDETAQRASYNAQGGYNGYRNTLSLKYTQNAWNYGAFVSYFNIDGAVFEDSPLVETTNALFVGSFISYTFYKK